MFKARFSPCGFIFTQYRVILFKLVSFSKFPFLIEQLQLRKHIYIYIYIPWPFWLKPFWLKPVLAQAVLGAPLLSLSLFLFFARWLLMMPICVLILLVPWANCGNFIDVPCHHQCDRRGLTPCWLCGSLSCLTSSWTHLPVLAELDTTSGASLNY